ncbi:thymidine phosphorylase [archaeon]|nr:thymidine phosphorylase [archaeon]
MELKVKTSKWAAGIPVAMLNRKNAEALGVHAGDRINLKTFSKNPKELSTILDITWGNLKSKKIYVTDEIKKMLSLKEGERVQVSLSHVSESSAFVKKKLLGKKLTKREIRQIIVDVVNNSLSEAEIAVFVSGMYENGMTFEETTYLVEAILFSGKRMKFKEKYVVDKHCIGGIAGNRTTPVVVSICAAAGLIFPKTSSRAITSAAGTADCIEVLSPVEFSMEKLKKIVEKVGACLSWGGSVGMVPADSKIIQIEKMLKLDPPAQLLASIISKKLAAGSKYILIDIPYGKGAKVTKRKGKKLKKKFEKLAHFFKVHISVVLTSSNEPIGNGVGPAMEIKDVIKILKRDEDLPKDLEKKSIFLAGEILELTKKAKKGEGEEMARKVLESGKAYKKFEEIIKAQGGKVKEIIPSKIKKEIFSKNKGKIKSINNQEINYLARIAGCPLDKYAGVFLNYHVGEKIKKGQKILTIYAESKPRLKEAVKYYEEKMPIKI